MRDTGNYVIVREGTEEFLHAIRESESVYELGWCKGPSGAQKYKCRDTATQVAQGIADRKGYRLVVCGVHESETQIGLADPIQVRPSADPDMN